MTDALACACAENAEAFDPRVIIEDGVCKLSDRSALAGSVATMDRLIRTLVHGAEIPLEDAIRMASETPAKIMGVYDRKGSLARGKDADLIILDKDLNLRQVWAMGKLVEAPTLFDTNSLKYIIGAPRFAAKCGAPIIYVSAKGLDKLNAGSAL